MIYNIKNIFDNPQYHTGDGLDNSIINDDLLEYVWRVSPFFFSEMRVGSDDEMIDFSPSAILRFCQLQHALTLPLEDGEDKVMLQKMMQRRDLWNNRFKTNYKDILTETEKFGYDKDKFYYLIFFVHEIVQDRATQPVSPTPNAARSLEQLEEALSDAVSLTVAKTSGKPHIIAEPPVINLLKEIVHSRLEEMYNLKDKLMEVYENNGIEGVMADEELSSMFLPSYNDSKLTNTHAIYIFVKAMSEFLPKTEKGDPTRQAWLFIGRILFCLGYFDNYSSVSNRKTESFYTGLDYNNKHINPLRDYIREYTKKDAPVPKEGAIYG